MGLGWRDKIPCDMLMDEQERKEVERVNETLKHILNDCGQLLTASSVDAVCKRKEFRHCSCDEVFPNIFLGGMEAAKNKNFLKVLGVTHVVNAALGDCMGMVDTNATYYSDVNMKFIGFRMMDFSHIDISQYFNESSNFIENALASGGKVFVHCVMGVSRSATLVCAFLMMKRGFSAIEAMKLIRTRRFVHPNPGFLERLAILDVKLRRDQLGRGVLGAK